MLLQYKIVTFIAVALHSFVVMGLYSNSTQNKNCGANQNLPNETKLAMSLLKVGKIVTPPDIIH